MTAPGKRRASGGPEVLDVEILVRVNRDRREAYKAACAARGTTMADVAREALEGLLTGSCGHVYPNGQACAGATDCEVHSLAARFG